MKHVCKLCGYVYDDSLESTPFDQLPEDWVCPVCGATKDAVSYTHLTLPTKA